MGQKSFFVLAFLAWAVTGFGQEITFGARGGFTFSKWNTDIDDDYRKTRTGIILGINAEMPLTDRVSVQADLLYAMMGGKFRNSYEKAVYRTNYLLVPVVGKYNFENGISLLFGPQLGLLLSANYDIDDESYDLKDDLKSTDVFLVFGAEYHLKQGIALGLRIHHGLTNIETGASTEIHNRSFSLDATYKLDQL